MSLQKLIEEQLKQFVEKGADLEHDRWARWQKYLFSKCTPHKTLSRNAKTNQEEEIETGNLVINRDLVERWQRQINTPYAELSEAEKESDRKETRNYLPLLEETIQLIIDGVVEMVKEELEIQNKVQEKAKEVVVVGRKKVNEMLQDKHIRQGKIAVLEDIISQLQTLKK